MTGPRYDPAPAPKEYPGGTVFVTMSMDMAMALTRCIVRYLSLPEAPLLPPAEEGLLLQAYDAIHQVTEPPGWFRAGGGQDDGEEPGQGREAAP